MVVWVPFREKLISNNTFAGDLGKWLRRGSPACALRPAPHPALHPRLCLSNESAKRQTSPRSRPTSTRPHALYQFSNKRKLNSI